MAKGKYQYWLTKEGLVKLEGWAREGLTDEEIAGKIGIRRSTLSDWKNRFVDISDTLKKGKEVIDFEVEQALLKRALGSKYDEKTYERIWNDKLGRYIKVNTKIVTKHIVPDTTAQIFWLKNRKPDKWRDKQEIEHSGEMNVTSPLDEINRRIAGIAQRAGADKDS
jgi:transcriptional regulator with XRE-family HTH domain